MLPRTRFCNRTQNCPQPEYPGWKAPPFIRGPRRPDPAVAPERFRQFRRQPGVGKERGDGRFGARVESRLGCRSSAAALAAVGDRPCRLRGSRCHARACVGKRRFARAGRASRHRRLDRAFVHPCGSDRVVVSAREPVRTADGRSRICGLSLTPLLDEPRASVRDRRSVHDRYGGLSAAAGALPPCLPRVPERPARTLVRADARRSCVRGCHWSRPRRDDAQ